MPYNSYALGLIHFLASCFREKISLGFVTVPLRTFHQPRCCPLDSFKTMDMSSEVLTVGLGGVFEVWSYQLVEQGFEYHSQKKKKYVLEYRC